jgi:hypothetical protein
MSIREVLENMRDYVGFVPGLVVSFVVTLVVGPLVGRALRVSVFHGWALVMSFGLILSATVTPSREAILSGATGSGVCDLSSIGPGTWWQLTHLDEVTLNIILFVPLGISLGALPNSDVKVGLIAWAFLLPLLIELLQLVVVALDRACQSIDLADNLVGLAVGLGIGLVGARLLGIGPPGPADRSAS